MRESVWLYDTITEEFRQVPEIALRQEWDIRFRGSRGFHQVVPSSRWGRLVNWLFLMGGICPILMGALLLLTLGALLLGYR
jgi:hypothetical protein